MTFFLLNDKTIILRHTLQTSAMARAKMNSNPVKEHSYHNQVTVLGAGWSGILATKYMLEEGLTVATLERRDNLGGVWYYSDDSRENTVMKSTIASSSSAVTEMSDYPMPNEIGYFPHHKDMLQYLHSYADHFHLLPHIHFNTTVEKATKQNDKWYVYTSNEVFISDFLIVCTGQSKPNRELSTTLFKDFAGSIYHAAEIKEPIKHLEGCRLLIVGGGETGSDLCSEWYNYTSLIYWSIPRGQHFFRRYTKILPWRKPQILDKVSSRLITTIAPYHRSKPGLSWICKWTSNGSLLAYQGHGISEWKNDSKFFHFFVNKNGKVLDLIDYEKVVPKGGIQSCNGKLVTFSDETQQEFDTIILSTGYSPVFTFLDKEHRKKSFRARYKHVFDNADPTIAFIGYIRPVVGSIPSIAEVQARWVAKVFSNHIVFPSEAKRVNITEKDAAFWSNYFKETSQRLETIVEGYMYVNNIAKLAGVYPDYYALFRRNIHHWYVSMVSPFNGSFYRLNEPEQEDKAIATLNSHRVNTITPVHLLLILFLRLIWFDWILNQLEKLKYVMQTSSFGKKLQRIPAVKFINKVWCIPKRAIFDNQTDVPKPHT